MGRNTYTKEQQAAYRRSGASLSLYHLRLAEQDGKCAICRLPEADNRDGRLHFDHDHATGILRGLLCSNCNTALGLLRDDPERIEAALAYIARYRP